MREDESNHAVLVGGPLDGTNLGEVVNCRWITFPVSRRLACWDDLLKAPPDKFDGRFAKYERRGDSNLFDFVGMSES